MTINLTVLDLSAGSAPLAGAGVYVWHCDREGRYSRYSPGRDNVCGDGWTDELGVVSGTVSSGLSVALNVAVR